MTKKNVTFVSALWGSAENRIRSLVGLPPVSTRRHTLQSWATTGVQRKLIAFLGLERAEQLPEGWPVDVFETLDRYVEAKGGSMKVADGLTVPLLKLNRRSAVVLPGMWIAYVDFESEGANFKALQAAEESLEDALARECGEQYNLRIMSKPARIEIDNPQPPLVKLADKWPLLCSMERFNYVVGLESRPSGNSINTNRLDSANEFGAAFFGASGSGKTQGLMGATLSLCANTSPADLSVVIIDPKGIDLTPFETLPHLACPVITDAEQGANVVFDVLAEMDRRVKAGDPSAAQKRILLVIDELGDLLMQQKGNDLEIALTRLGQKGRAWGFSMFLGSQRAVNESFPRSVQTNLPCMIVGRVKSAGEAAFASGLPGCDAHKLPGKGAFMVYEPGAEGVRVQGLFVADSNKPDYAKHVGVFIEDIRSKWAGVQPHWIIGKQLVEGSTGPIQSHADGVSLRAMVEDAVRTVLLDMATVKEATDEASTAAEETPKLETEATIISTIGDAAFYELRDLFDADPDKFSQRKMREVLEQHEGKRRSTGTEKALYLALKSFLAE